MVGLGSYDPILNGKRGLISFALICLFAVYLNRRINFKLIALSFNIQNVYIKTNDLSISLVIIAKRLIPTHTKGSKAWNIKFIFSFHILIWKIRHFHFMAGIGFIFLSFTIRNKVNLVAERAQIKRFTSHRRCCSNSHRAKWLWHMDWRSDRHGNYKRF